MSISYPLTAPVDTIGLAQIQITPRNAVAISRSPFTFSTQVHAYSGQAWDANVTIANCKREEASEWTSFLTALRGQFGTFLLGDPDGASPQGTSTSATITGTSGSGSVSVTMSGSLLAGDYIQLGLASDATLHKVIQDQTGDGTLEIWPALRKNRSDVWATLINPRGLFRLTTNSPSWTINSNSFYNISFQATEAI